MKATGFVMLWYKGDEYTLKEYIPLLAAINEVYTYLKSCFLQLHSRAVFKHSRDLRTIFNHCHMIG